MASGPSTPQVVVVHAGEIVVNQRVGVDALDCARCGKGCLRFAAAHLGRCESERRAKSFSTGEHAVAHGFVNCRGLCGGFWNKCVEGSVNAGNDALQVILNLHELQEIERVQLGRRS